MEQRTDHADTAAHGEMVAQLSREIVQLHARLFGRGPTKARSYLEQDYAFCVLAEIFTAGERKLVDAGLAEHVRETREKFQDAVRGEFKEIVERITGRQVSVVLSQVDVDSELALEFFLFADAPPGREG